MNHKQFYRKSISVKWVMITLFFLFMGVACQQNESSSAITEPDKQEQDKVVPNGDDKAATSISPDVLKTLSAYFPEFEGFKKEGELQGNSADFNKFSISQAVQKYLSPDNKELRVTIFDYVNATALHETAKAAVEQGVNVENDKHKTSTVAFDKEGVAGLLVVQKKDNSAHLTITAADRFIVSIQGTGEEMVTKAGKAMPFDQMQ